MEKFKLLQRIQQLYANGENIIQYLKSIDNSSVNTIEDILISYDFQSGTYIQSFFENPEFKKKYCKALADIINDFKNIDSIVEVGVGEATTLSTLIKNLNHTPSSILGFDISWSRLKFAKGLLQDFNLEGVHLFAANMFETPLANNAIDVVYTSHSIEPNGGREEQALKELYRITNKYLVLLEPAYELANDEAKARMKSHGYVTELYSTAKKLGYKVLEHRLFEYSANPLNPTGLIIIEKENSKHDNSELVCPISKSALIKYNESLLYSKDSFLAYPMIDNIPCLLKENAILATHLLTDYNQYKAEHNISF